MGLASWTEILTSCISPKPVLGLRVGRGTGFLGGDGIEGRAVRSTTRSSSSTPICRSVLSVRVVRVSRGTRRRLPRKSPCGRRGDVRFGVTRQFVQELDGRLGVVCDACSNARLRVPSQLRKQIRRTASLLRNRHSNTRIFVGCEYLDDTHGNCLVVCNPLALGGEVLDDFEPNGFGGGLVGSTTIRLGGATFSKSNELLRRLDHLAHHITGTVYDLPAPWSDPAIRPVERSSDPTGASARRSPPRRTCSARSSPPAGAGSGPRRDLSALRVLSQSRCGEPPASGGDRHRWTALVSRAPRTGLARGGIASTQDGFGSESRAPATGFGSAPLRVWARSALGVTSGRARGRCARPRGPARSRSSTLPDTNGHGRTRTPPLVLRP